MTSDVDWWSRDSVELLLCEAKGAKALERSGLVASLSYHLNVTRSYIF
jgi:hypothetical protein